MSDTNDQQISRFVSVPDIYASEDSEQLKKAEQELQAVLTPADNSTESINPQSPVL